MLEGIAMGLEREDSVSQVLPTWGHEFNPQDSCEKAELGGRHLWSQHWGSQKQGSLRHPGQSRCLCKLQATWETTYKANLCPPYVCTCMHIYACAHIQTCMHICAHRLQVCPLLVLLVASGLSTQLCLLRSYHPQLGAECSCCGLWFE